MASKKYISIFGALFFAINGLAGQAAVAASAASNELPERTALLLVAICVTLIVAALWTIIRANSFMTKRLLRLEAEKHGITLPEELIQPGMDWDAFWTNMRKKYWENPVPRAQEGEIMLSHNYDGIRELDNHLPPWWINMFILTCIWSLGYMWYYHWGGDGPDQTAEYQTEMAIAKVEKAKVLAGKAEMVNEANVTALSNAAALEEGATIFKGLCAACHGQLGEGGVGPNMTDEQWIHGGGIKNIFKTIKYGVPEKGMIAWSAQLKPSDIQKVSSYILTLKGTNPPNAKAPQGEIWNEATAPAEAPSTQK
jgi:cytochrome c oxidase cbb3-type subunit III